MQPGSLDVVGIGNAIVDVLTHADEEFLRAQSLDKGSMTLIDTARAEALYAAMGPGVESSGGSAANTMAGLASLGASGGFIGKVRDDQLGKIFRHDITAGGTVYRVAPASEGAPTARCLIFVTPDAQRTMATYLGTSITFGPEDLDLELVRAGKVLYLEGYLWDAPPAKEAFLKAAEAARGAGAKIALSLSDAFCVERHRESFRELVDGHVDILFANETEILSLYEAKGFEQAVDAVKGHCEVAALTRSEKGSLILADGQAHQVAAMSLGELVDTTGAGDAYAAGFLYGYSKGFDLPTCGRYGSLAAGEVITHMGPRPEHSLAELARDKLD